MAELSEISVTCPKSVKIKGSKMTINFQCQENDQFEHLYISSLQSWRRKAGKLYSKSSIGYPASGSTDVITSYPCNFDKSNYRGYCYQILVVTTLSLIEVHRALLLHWGSNIIIYWSRDIDNLFISSYRLCSSMQTLSHHQLLVSNILPYYISQKRQMLLWQLTCLLTLILMHKTS